MQRPSLLDFAPAPCRKRHAGWTPDRQKRFVAELAMRGDVGEAAAAAGCSRQSAYVLRARPGAEGFAAAWDEALRVAHEARRIGTTQEKFMRGLPALLVPRFYGGKLIGFTEHEDCRHQLRRLHQLERWLLAKGDKDDMIDEVRR